MFKFILCALIVSSSAFASEGQKIINTAAGDLAVYFAGKGDSNCSFQGSTLTAKFEKFGKVRSNSFSLKSRSGVDLSASVDSASSTVRIERGLLFTTDVLNLTYEGEKISEVEMVIASGSEIETVVKCN